MNGQSVDKKPRLVIYGAWYYSKVVAEAAELSGWDVEGFVDPDPPPGTETLTHIPAGSSVFVAIGDNSLRAFVYAKLQKDGRNLVSILHPTAVVSPSASLGEGCYLAEYAVIRANSQVGPGTLLNSGSVVSHDCQVGSFVTFGPNAATGGRVTIGERTLIGVGASIRPQCAIASGCIVGAGAVVIGDVSANQSVVGVSTKSITDTEVSKRQSDWGANSVW